MGATTNADKQLRIVLGALVATLVYPLAGVLISALTGLILQTLFGGWLVAGAATLGFPLVRESIWQAWVVLALVGSVFRFSPIGISREWNKDKL